MDKNGNAWRPEVYKNEVSAEERHKFVHCPFPELGHPLCNASAQQKARTDCSVFTKSKQSPDTPGKQTYIAHSKESLDRTM